MPDPQKVSILVHLCRGLLVNLFDCSPPSRPREDKEEMKNLQFPAVRENNREVANSNHPSSSTEK